VLHLRRFATLLVAVAGWLAVAVGGVEPASWRGAAEASWTSATRGVASESLWFEAEEAEEPLAEAGEGGDAPSDGPEGVWRRVGLAWPRLALASNEGGAPAWAAPRCRLGGWRSRVTGARGPPQG
jgi:hypothetical protein